MLLYFISLHLTWLRFSWWWIVCLPRMNFGSAERAGVSLLLSVNSGRIGIFLWLHLCPLVKSNVCVLHSGPVVEKLISLSHLWWISVTPGGKKIARSINSSYESGMYNIPATETKMLKCISSASNVSYLSIGSLKLGLQLTVGFIISNLTTIYYLSIIFWSLDVLFLKN